MDDDARLVMRDVDGEVGALVTWLVSVARVRVRVGLAVVAMWVVMMMEVVGRASADSLG